MRNMGEACTAANRLYVHRSIADTFSERLAVRLAALTVGNGLEPDRQVGPLIDAAGRNKVQHLADDALGRGAKALTASCPKKPTAANSRRNCCNDGSHAQRQKRKPLCSGTLPDYLTHSCCILLDVCFNLSGCTLGIT